MEYLIVDFETYWDKDVTLKKLSYSEYVYHPEFEVLGAAVGYVGHPKDYLRKDMLWHYFKSVNWANTCFIAHNVPFDGFVLHHVYDIHPAAYFCTMAATEALFQSAIGRSLDAVGQFLGAEVKLGMPNFKGKHDKDISNELFDKMAEYALRDAEVCEQLFSWLQPRLPEKERQLMSMTLGMFCNPVLQIDKELAREAAQEALEEQNQKVLATGHSATVLRSAAFRQLLVDQGIEPPTKISPSDPNEDIDAFAQSDDEFMALRDHENPQVRALVEGRLAVKSTIHVTRPRRLLQMAESGSGQLAVCLHYARAHTWRWTGGNKLNLQNFVSGSKARRAIIAPPGYKLGVADSGQIECRSLGSLAREYDLLDAFAERRDPYSELATDIFGHTVTKADIDERFVGKTAELGLGFTMGWQKFQLSVRTTSRKRLGREIILSDELCQTVVAKYRRKRARIVHFWGEAERLLYCLAYKEPFNLWEDRGLHVDVRENRIWFPNGTYLYYPGFYQSEGGFHYTIQRKNSLIRKDIHRGLVVENIIQKWARDIVAEQLLVVNDRYRVVMTTHDEGVALIPTREAEEGHAWMLQQFTIPPPWALGIPLSSEGGIDDCYSK